MSDSHRCELVDEVRRFDATTEERFDRVAYALAAFRLLRTPGLTVAVYLRRAGTRFEAVRDLRGDDGARWALCGVSPRESRAQIARAVAELSGIEDVPYAVDLLSRIDGADG